MSTRQGPSQSSLSKHLNILEAQANLTVLLSLRLGVINGRWQHGRDGRGRPPTTPRIFAYEVELAPERPEQNAASDVSDEARLRLLGGATWLLAHTVSVESNFDMLQPTRLTMSLSWMMCSSTNPCTYSQSMSFTHSAYSNANM